MTINSLQTRELTAGPNPKRECRNTRPCALLSLLASAILHAGLHDAWYVFAFNSCCALSLNVCYRKDVPFCSTPAHRRGTAWPRYGRSLRSAIARKHTETLVVIQR